MKPKRHWLALIFVPVLLAGLSSPFWSPFLGTLLVRGNDPVKSDAVVVLAGDGWGLRVEKGGELVRDGWAPVAIVSGPIHYYGRAEAELAVDWAVKKGYPRKLFLPMPVPCSSTEDEAIGMAEAIRRQRPEVKRILLVTSNYHTARSNRIWQKVAGRYFEIHTVAAPDRDVVDPARWWANREGRKKIFFEWIKTLTGPLGV